MRLVQGQGRKFKGASFLEKRPPLIPRKAQGRGDFDSPPPVPRPFETTKEGPLRWPLFGNTPELSYFRRDGLRAALCGGPTGTGAGAASKLCRQRRYHFNRLSASVPLTYVLCAGQEEHWERKDPVSRTIEHLVLTLGLSWGVWRGYSLALSKNSPPHLRRYNFEISHQTDD